MTQFVPPAALFGLAQDLVLKGWQPVWCIARQSGAYTPIPGTTGGSAPYPSIEPQPTAAHKLAFRPPPSVIVFDVDHYDDKRGMDTMDRAEDWLGELPQTWRVTARGYANPSGRYLFRKPGDLDFTDSALAQFADEDGRTSVEVVRTSHRFSWAPGDIHYKNNELVQCFDPDGDVCESMPEVSELPELPQRWADYLRNPPVPQHASAYTRPSDGPEWWLSQADDSLGTRAELAQFAFDMLASRQSPACVTTQLHRVSVALNPAEPWEDAHFSGLVDGNTERKVGEQLARQDAEVAVAAGVAGGYDELAQIAARTAAEYAADEKLRQRRDERIAWTVQSQFAFDAIPLEAEAGDDERGEEFALDALIRGTPEYDRQFRMSLARMQAEKDVHAILSAKFTGYKKIGSLPPPPAPATMKVTGKGVPGTCVIPPGTVVCLSGHKGGGKSWVAATWAEQEIIAGNHVLWVDFERQASGLSERFSVLRVPAHLIDGQVHYADGVLPPVDGMCADIRKWAEGGRRVLVVVDAFRGLQATVAPGTSANDGDAVETVYLEVLNPLTEAGATVAVIDHLAKNGNGTTFGSERKESAADYVLRVEQAEAFSRGRSGYSCVELTKDRYGHREAGTAVGYLWVPGSDGKTGSSYRDYPVIPELRAWSPVTEQDEIAMEVSVKSQRETAITRVVAENRLRLGRNELARMMAELEPGLFAADTAAKPFLTRMTAEGKLFLDPGNRKYDVPQAPVTRNNQTLSALNNHEEDE